MAMIGKMVMKIEGFINHPQKSNMAAMRSDPNKLRNLNTPLGDIHIHEV